MKTKQKLEQINEKINRLNERLKNRSFKVEFENKGTNCYCLKLQDEEFYKFNTYDDVLNCLIFIDDMFNKASKEIESK